MDQIRLTQFSPGAGCGCKISPAVLEEILKHGGSRKQYDKLIVGNDSRDDAAVFDLGDGRALISTTDFFMPITDDPLDFGKIAAANAISDVYAMGGAPLLAIAILGWPLEKLSPETAGQVLEGARAVCAEAGIPLAGGHSIDSLEPIFGLAVTGLVELVHLKRNDTATPGCSLFLTKPLGTGILSTAMKRGKLLPEHYTLLRDQMVTLNKTGLAAGKLAEVKAMTDVTGFGLLGHLLEMCEGSGVSAVIDFQKVPVMKGVEDYLSEGCIPGGTRRNWQSYGSKIGPLTDYQRNMLCDPQTSGGLLMAVEEAGVPGFLREMENEGVTVYRLGRTIQKSGPEVIAISV